MHASLLFEQGYALDEPLVLRSQGVAPPSPGLMSGASRSLGTRAG
jgi:hypothetical protein